MGNCNYIGFEELGKGIEDMNIFDRSKKDKYINFLDFMRKVLLVKSIHAYTWSRIDGEIIFTININDLTVIKSYTDNITKIDNIRNHIFGFYIENEKYDENTIFFKFNNINDVVVYVNEVTEYINKLGVYMKTKKSNEV